MVDRATRYQNAMNQIQERNKPGQPVLAEIPDNTQERHVKSVRVFIGSSVSASQLMTFLA
jgi:hypothetical protein